MRGFDWFSTTSIQPVSLRDVNKPLAVREDGKVVVIPSVRMPTCGEELADELAVRILERKEREK